MTAWSGEASGWRVCLPVVVALLSLGLSACGSVDANAIVVRVGDTAITKAMVDHWTRVVQRGGAFTGFRGERRGGTPRERALALLISSKWLIDEAEREGLSVPEHAVRNALAERMQVGGASEFHKRLERSGQSIAGVEFEIKAEMALEAIRQHLARRAGGITPSQVSDFYRKNQRLFSGPETRVVDIVENLPSAAAASALLGRVGAGPGFTKLAIRKEMAYTTGLLAGVESKKKVDQAIFTARPGVASPPMRLFAGWTVFVVRKIIPPQPKPLASVYGRVLATLKQQRDREATRTFERAYRSRWIAETTCRDGYVVPGCTEYHGRLGSYEDPFEGS